MEEVEGERLRLKEKPRQSEAPLCLPWGAWAVVLQRQHPSTLLKSQASSKQPARGREGTGMAKKFWLLLRIPFR